MGSSKETYGCRSFEEVSKFTSGQEYSGAEMLS